MTKTCFALAASLLTLTASAFGQDQPEPPSRSARFLAQHDTDGDGAVTAEEVTQAAQDFIAAADADADGILTADEFRAGQSAQRFRALDTDQSGELSLEEFSAQGLRGLRGGRRARDEDGDGAISLEELTARVLEQLTNADADADGKVTAAELDAAPDQGRGGRGGQGRGGRGQGGDRSVMLQGMFEQLDVDGSGSLSPEELQAASSLRGRRGQRGQGQDESEEADPNRIY